MRGGVVMHGSNRCKGRHNEGLMLPYACGRTHCCADPSCQTGCVQVPHVASEYTREPLISTARIMSS